MKLFLTLKDSKRLASLIAATKREIEENSKRLGEAAAHGGSFTMGIPEYQSIDMKLRMLERKMSELDRIDRTYDKSEIASDNKANIYSRVDALDETGIKKSFYIYEPILTDQKLFKEKTPIVSVNSPVGQALIGKKTGQKVKLPPAGQTYLITKVESLQI
jgi:transcription elongation GreA/GreB family factor